jgi:hypothetical protein
MATSLTTFRQDQKNKSRIPIPREQVHLLLHHKFPPLGFHWKTSSLLFPLLMPLLLLLLLHHHLYLWKYHRLQRLLLNRSPAALNLLSSHRQDPRPTVYRICKQAYLESHEYTRQTLGRKLIYRSNPYVQLSILQPIGLLQI